MLIRYGKIFLVLFICLYMTGCAISNEGATDYRYIDHDRDLNKSIASKFIKPKDSKHPIKPGEALVISLKQIFIHDFVEFRSPLRWIRGEPSNGEIAIIVNAFEIGKGETTNFGPGGKQNARVVFFSDDVWEGQFLNLSNLSTIYGPLKYDGGPFILDLYVVEMDKPSEQLKQLLSNLAEIGSTFYPPSAPISGPLAQLAGTLIADDQDDRSYHHTAEFKSIGGDADLNTGILQTGDYVFIRKENRHTSTNWNELVYDEKTGRIVYSPNKVGKSHCIKPDNAKEYPDDCYFRDNSYVVVEINTAASSIKNDVKQMIYKDLSTKIFVNAASIFTTPIPGQTLENLAKEVKKTRAADAINKQLKMLENDSNSLVENTAALDRFINLWSEKDANNKIKHLLNDIDRERIDERLARIISTCQADQNEVLNLMNKLRNRMTFSAKNNRDVIAALSCSHKP